jgi:hypothetical protein
MMFARTTFRRGAGLALFAAIAWGQPSLTTISDVLFKADGTRFNGLAQFTWVSFESGNGSNIAQQTKTVRIIDGNLFVQLTPTTDATPPAQYSVKYSSDGRIQFQETWAVPASPTPLRVRDVRTTQPLFPGGGAGGGVGGVTVILESDVTGLVQDLAARAVKGPGYTNSRAAIINDSGGLEGAIGDPTDCVRVDGTSGPCNPIIFVDEEVPGGLVDGANPNFTLASAPSPVSSLHLYRNGLLQKAGFDYTLTGSTVAFVTASIPQSGDTILASYRH